MDVDLQVSKEKPKREEIINFKDKEGLELFRISTSNIKDFENCFNTKFPLLKQVEQWRKVLATHCKKSFKKIRIRKNAKMFVTWSIVKLIDRRNKLLEEGSEKELNDINKAIAELEATEKRNKIMKNFRSYSGNPKNVGLPKIWKLLKKLSPKFLHNYL